MEIIIPSAKIIPVELQNLGKLPAILYPVNQRIVFDYLYEQYGNANYKIVCYERIDKVKRRLARYENTEIIGLDHLGDLGYSIYSGLSGCQGEGYINFADTIVLDETSISAPDMFYYAEDTISSTWTFFEEKDGQILSIKDKQGGCEDNQGKLFVGVFRFSHLEYLRLCLEKALERKKQDMNSFYYALLLYSKNYPFLVVKAKDWLDIGHEDRYYNSTLEVKAREFNHITIDKNRGILRKSSDDTDKFIGEIKWYLKLPADIEYVRPRIFDYDLSYSSPYVSMEYYAYHTVHELFLYGDLSKRQWIDIFSRISFVCDDFKRYSLVDDTIHHSIEYMYLTKTVQRLDRLRTNSNFSKFFDSTIVVNEKKYKSLNAVIQSLKEYIPQMLYDVEKFSIIHGDLCFANIMIDNNFSFIKVIDPRGKFGKYDIYGDPRYELAKLFHSVDGKYDFIIKDLFNADFDQKKCTIHYEVLDRTRDYNLYRIFTDVFKEAIGKDLKKIELIESLLFLSMIPLHGESVKHQMVMLATGLDILNRVVDITVLEESEDV